MAREVAAILARAANGTIGRDGALPWRIPADLQRFKALTMGADGKGGTMIMGRKTFESLGKPLPGRRHIVLTRDSGWRADGAEAAHSPEEALALGAEGRVWVIGGAEIYRLMLPHTSRIELTEVHAVVAGDTSVPPFGPDWRETERSEHPVAGETPAFAFVTLQRVPVESA